MNLGKLLRLRRIFANGRALIVDFDQGGEDPVEAVRMLTRAGVDALVLSPGSLDRVAEDLASLAVILRIESGISRVQQLVTLQGALEMGAEAVFLGVALGDAGESESLEKFGRVTEEARRLGMPVFAEMAGKDWLEAARLGAEYGADVLQTRFDARQADFRHFVRTTGRPLVVSVREPQPTDRGVLHLINDALQAAAQGVVLGREVFTQPDPSPLLAAVHGLLHQGISVEEALLMTQQGGGGAAPSEIP